MSTISRWRTQGRLPEPATGPKQRGIRWTEAAIKAWEAAGFVTNIGEWKENLEIVRMTVEGLKALIATPGANESAVGLARAGLRVLNNANVPLRARVIVCNGLLGADWGKAIGEIDDDDRERAIKVRYLLGQLHRKHGGRTNG